MRTPAAGLAIYALMLLPVAASAAAGPARAPWFSAADARCASATVEGKRLVATIPSLRTKADGMAFLRKGVGIQARLFDRLRAAGPPRDAGVQRFMSLFARSVELDRKSLTELERGVDKATIQRWIDEGGRLEASARRVATQIGLRECARYMDPATYK